MSKFVFLSFVFMAFAFYELSGGDEFVPRKAELIAAAKEAEQDQAKARIERVAQLRPEPAPVQPAVSQVSLRIKPAPPPPAAPKAVVTTAQGEVADKPVLIALGQNLELFANPAQQLTVAGLSAQPARLVAEPEMPDIREVSASRVNMRNGPGTEYSVLVSLPQGTEVEVIDADGTGWVKLRIVNDSRVGWMAEYLLTEPTG